MAQYVNAKYDNSNGASDGTANKPWLHVEDINTPAIGEEIILADDTDYYMSAGLNLGRNGTSVSPIIWRAESSTWTDITRKPRLHAGIRIDNNASYAWVLTANDEYYLTAVGGGNPGLTEIKTATINDYYRGSSVSGNNSATEQRATTVVSGNDQVIGSMTGDGTVWGWGDNDSLGYSTFYFKPAPGHVPNDYKIEASQIDYLINTNWRYHQFNDLIFNLGNIANVTGSGYEWVMNRSILANADFNCIASRANHAGVVQMTLNACLLSQSHRAVGHAHNSWLEVNNCVGHNNHLFMLVAATLDPTAPLRNNICWGGESGFIDNKSASHTIDEQNNFMYPRMNDGVNALGYVSPANWTTTNASSMPANVATSTGNQSSLRDVNFVRTDLHDWKKCDFRLAASPALAGGQPIAAGTTDIYGTEYHAVSPNAGIYAGDISSAKVFDSTLGNDGWETSQTPDNTKRSATLGAQGYEVPPL
jgi:hypothetical protein